jgi:hypothetical protein
VRRLDVEGRIKPKQKRNAEVQVGCVMRNKWIDGLITTHSLAPLFKQKQMWVLDAKEMESSSKIDLRDVSWWMSIKDAYRLGAVVIAKFSKEGCIFLIVGRRPSCTTCKHD